MELNSTVLMSVLDRTDFGKSFLKNFTLFVLFMYNHMIYFIGIPQVILNLMVAAIIIYSSRVRLHYTLSLWRGAIELPLVGKYKISGLNK